MTPHEEAINAVLDAYDAAYAVPPIRQVSARGKPAEPSKFARTCANCHASFLGLAPGKTGERGLWDMWSWYCSVECAPASLVKEDPQ